MIDNKITAQILQKAISFEENTENSKFWGKFGGNLLKSVPKSIFNILQNRVLCVEKILSACSKSISKLKTHSP